MSSLHLGVLAEDETDCKTMAELIRRMHPGSVGIRRRFGGGCSQLMRKARVWMAELSDEGCTAIIFVHDLDLDPANGMRNDEARLRREIEHIAVPAGLLRHICIPVEELEAWFWADGQVLERVAPQLGRTRAHTSPHNLRRPKEALMRLAAKAHGKYRYTPQMNPELAKILDLDLCASRCQAFRDLRAFLAQLG